MPASVLHLRDMREVLGAHYDAVTAADKVRKAKKPEKRRQQGIEWDRIYDELEAAGKRLPDDAGHGPSLRGTFRLQVQTNTKRIFSEAKLKVPRKLQKSSEWATNACARGC